jgi:hypothetical protein
MYYVVFFIYAAVLAVAIYQLRPKPPKPPPVASEYDYGDHCCDGIGWD